LHAAGPYLNQFPILLRNQSCENDGEVIWGLGGRCKCIQRQSPNLEDEDNANSELE